MLPSSLSAFWHQVNAVIKDMNPEYMYKMKSNTNFVSIWLEFTFFRVLSHPPLSGSMAKGIDGNFGENSNFLFILFSCKERDEVRMCVWFLIRAENKRVSQSFSDEFYMGKGSSSSGSRKGVNENGKRISSFKIMTTECVVAREVFGPTNMSCSYDIHTEAKRVSSRMRQKAEQSRLENEERWAWSEFVPVRALIPLFFCVASLLFNHFLPTKRSHCRLRKA